MTKKILIIAVVAVVLIALLAVLAIFSNRDGSDNPTETTAPSGSTGNETQGPEDGFVPDNLPDNLDFGNAEVWFLAWSDYTMVEFWAEGESGDLVGDSVFKRNNQVEERLGVTLKYHMIPGNDGHMTEFIKTAEMDISSGTHDYDIIAGYSRTAPAMALDGLLEDLTALEYLDFDMPWWPSSLIDQCELNNKLYFCSGDISTNLLWMMVATFFNKSLIETYDLEDPYELVRSGKWTLDKMIEMTSNRYSDNNGDGAVDVGDTFGYSMYNINIDAFFNATGFTALKKNNIGELIISPDFSNQTIIDLLDKLGNWFATNDVYFANSTTIRQVFFEERSIFTTDRVFIVAGKDNGGSSDKIEFNYGVIPNPKYNEAQASYSTNVGHPFTMYAISIGAFDADICAATLECLASESYRTVTPDVFEAAMKIKYAEDETAAEMYDILRSTVSFDMGRFYSKQVGDVYSNMRTQVLNNQKTFASQFKGLKKIMETGIKTITDAYEK